MSPNLTLIAQRARRALAPAVLVGVLATMSGCPVYVLPPPPVHQSYPVYGYADDGYYYVNQGVVDCPPGTAWDGQYCTSWETSGCPQGTMLYQDSCIPAE
ncbi:MAG: hypothetical protein O3A25_20310, partial [Acidobacteria bacterium]|nr:hypothetical protein [Acidobacteriota bacterium]